MIRRPPRSTRTDTRFPYTRSSDLWPVWRAKTPDERAALMHKAAGIIRDRVDHIATLLTLEQGKPIAEARGEVLRSEEHTSELQSLMRISYAVFCLKTKNTKNTSST